MGGAMLAVDIDDVLTMLAEIVADAKARKDPLGYFGALYRQVTLKVRAGINQGLFDDGPRMSTFDAQFANAFFTAYAQYRDGQRPSRAWEFAFDRTRSGECIAGLGARGCGMEDSSRAPIV